MFVQKLNFKKIKHQNYIICTIFKVRRPKCVFLEILGMPPMYNTLVILIFIFSIPPSTKKSKVIGYKL
jgi:hypothetical protein